MRRGQGGAHLETGRDGAASGSPFAPSSPTKPFCFPCSDAIPTSPCCHERGRGLGMAIPNEPHLVTRAPSPPPIPTVGHVTAPRPARPVTEHPASGVDSCGFPWGSPSDRPENRHPRSRGHRETRHLFPVRLLTRMWVTTTPRFAVFSSLGVWEHGAALGRGEWQVQEAQRPHQMGDGGGVIRSRPRAWSLPPFKVSGTAGPS